MLRLASARAGAASASRRNCGLERAARVISTSGTSRLVAPEAVEAPEVPSRSPDAWRDEIGRVRNDWTRAEVENVYHTPLIDLVYIAATVHRQHHDPREVQKCTLLSVKTGGCPETCKYCSQSSSWSKTTGTKAERLMDLESVIAAAERAKAAGSTRFCMGAAWRGPSQVGERQFQRVLEMVKRVRGMGLEVCTTLGMLTDEQAKRLREAGLSAYNHNLDTSREYYAKITSSRKYDDRLATIERVRQAGVSVCAGGIIGLGEANNDRIGLLQQLATLPAHPESVPINSLVAVKGTPLEGREPATGLELVRCVATARVLMPRSVVRLSAGRTGLSVGDQAMAFLAGANSIFSGDKLLTTPNNDADEDEHMFQDLGLVPRPAFRAYPAGQDSTATDFEIPQRCVVSEDAPTEREAAGAEYEGGCGGQLEHRCGGHRA